MINLNLARIKYQKTILNLKQIIKSVNNKRDFLGYEYKKSKQEEPLSLVSQINIWR